MHIVCILFSIFFYSKKTRLLFKKYNRIFCRLHWIPIYFSTITNLNVIMWFALYAHFFNVFVLYRTENDRKEEEEKKIISYWDICENKGINKITITIITIIFFLIYFRIEYTIYWHVIRCRTTITATRRNKNWRRCIKKKMNSNNKKPKSR